MLAACSHPISLSVCLQGKIKSLEQIYLFSLAVKEYQIVDFFLGGSLKDEVRPVGREEGGC